jgi:hypothetical protein
MRHAIAAAVTVAGLALLAAPAGAATELRQPCPYTAAGQTVQGCYDEAGDTIYYDTGRTLWHERGHAFARRALTESDHAWFARLLGMPGRPWISATPGAESPDERFADVYAACKMRVRARPGRAALTGYGFVIQADGRYKRICLAINVLEIVR